jgi:nickel-dependent lactate racemase
VYNADAMARFELAYGQGRISFEVPDGNLLSVVEPKPADPVPLEQAFAEAWGHPAGMESADAVVRRGERVAIVVPDHTRAVPIRDLLTLLWGRLKGKVRSEDVTIVVATGTHRPSREEELARMLGDFRKLFRVEVHDAERCVEIGRTRRGIPVGVNPTVMEADRVITIGHIGMHFFAGYSGGPKMILPGVAGAETIRLNHEQIVDPKAYACVCDENPIHAEMREVARMVGVDLIVDVVLSPRGVLKVLVGDVIEAHRAGAAFWDERFHVPIPEQADLVIVSPGGHPRDINLYQAHKAIFNAARAVKDGGMIVLLAACPDGSGHPVFDDWARRSEGLGDVLRIIREEGFKIGGHKVYFLGKDRLRGIEHFLISEMPAEEARALWMTPAKCVEEVLAIARERYGPNYSVTVMPHGADTFPVLD